MRKIALFISFLFLFANLGQSQNLSGYWSGELTQITGEDSEDVIYEFSLSIHHRKKQLSGQSFVAIDDIYALISFEGEFDGKTASFKEIEILKEKVELDLTWCIKYGDLKYSIKSGEAVLEGVWHGNTEMGPCDNGKVILRREIDRADIEKPSINRIR